MLNTAMWVLIIYLINPWKYVNFSYTMRSDRRICVIHTWGSKRQTLRGDAPTVMHASHLPLHHQAECEATAAATRVRCQVLRLSAPLFNQPWRWSASSGGVMRWNKCNPFRERRREGVQFLWNALRDWLNVTQVLYVAKECWMSLLGFITVYAAKMLDAVHLRCLSLKWNVYLWEWSQHPDMTSSGSHALILYNRIYTVDHILTDHLS